DNFASIVAAVEEGRGIYHNIRQIVHYLLASNASELLVMLIGVGVGWPPPLLAIQILWINLVTDGLPALALATEPPDPALMTRPPRPRQQPMLTRALALRIARQGVVLTVLALLMFHFTYHGDPAQVDAARTRLFATLCFSQLFFALACRSDHATLRELGVLSNKALLGAVAAGCAAQAGLMLLPATRHLFRLTLLSPFEWAIILLASVIPVLWIELTKPGRSRQASPTATAGGHDEALDRV
ncbi:MAG: cation transporting ATPase C-terminal domain-containing protein, partial [Tepidisphaeraceae bacterium]